MSEQNDANLQGGEPKLVLGKTLARFTDRTSRMPRTQLSRNNKNVTLLNTTKNIKRTSSTLGNPDGSNTPQSIVEGV
jgi:hypothetical protein